MSFIKTLPAISAILFAQLISAQDLSYGDCITKSASRWGAVCEKCEVYKDGYKRDFSGTYTVDLKNSCGDMVEIKVAVQESNGTWRIFPVRALEPGESTTVFACQGTGKYLYWARRVNDTEIILPSDHEIAATYKER
jgi:hypothetical protein